MQQPPPPPTERLNNLIQRLQITRGRHQAQQQQQQQQQEQEKSTVSKASGDRLVINGRDVRYLRQAFLEASIAEYRQSVLASMPGKLASSAAAAVASAAVTSKYKALAESLRKEITA
jgi:hypothetical protein